jgi:hypothetical protein
VADKNSPGKMVDELRAMGHGPLPEELFQLLNDVLCEIPPHKTIATRDPQTGRLWSIGAELTGESSWRLDLAVNHMHSMDAWWGDARHRVLKLSPGHEALHRENPKAGRLRVSAAAWGPVSGEPWPYRRLWPKAEL